MTCDKCGAELEIGDHPFCPHGKPLAYVPFVPYFDVALGCQINSFADRWREMRRQNVQYRDKMSKGALSARRDRIEQQRKERAS